MIDVSIIILSFNGKELLARTLDSVNRAGCSRLQIEVIVSDNGSTDGSVAMVKQDYPWVILVENNENLGFSKGNNRGVMVSKGNYVLFLNSDTEIYPGSIEYIYDQLEKNLDIGVATCRVELVNGDIDPASHRGFPTPWRAFTYFSGLERLITKIHAPFMFKQLFGGYHLLEKDLLLPHEIDCCTGAFLMLKRETGEKIGWWSEEYFMYGEDLDFCYKVKALGLKVMYFPEHKILHLKHASGLKKGMTEITLDPAEIERSKQIRRKTTEAFYDAMIVFYEKFYTKTYPGIIREMVYFFIRLKKMWALRKI